MMRCRLRPAGVDHRVDPAAARVGPGSPPDRRGPYAEIRSAGRRVARWRGGQRPGTATPCRDSARRPCASSCLTDAAIVSIVACSKPLSRNDRARCRATRPAAPRPARGSAVRRGCARARSAVGHRSPRNGKALAGSGRPAHNETHEVPFYQTRRTNSQGERNGGPVETADRTGPAAEDRFDDPARRAARDTGRGDQRALPGAQGRDQAARPSREGSGPQPRSAPATTWCRCCSRTPPTRAIPRAC